MILRYALAIALDVLVPSGGLAVPSNEIITDRVYRLLLDATPVTLEGKEWTVREAMKAICGQAEVSFTLEPGLSYRTVRIGFKDKPLHSALTAILDPAGGSYDYEAGILMARLRR